ncbi:hypothetical protein LCGC14_1125640 [marine sediment metagenome]|uniref:Uncharacterized protein n=1 Tax=marine sediment metagenome TaxID=412755 RepID=A0A0F9PKN7_9ZZZZ
MNGRRGLGILYFQPQLAFALGFSFHFAPWRRHVHLDLHLPFGILIIGTWQHVGDDRVPIEDVAERR